MIGFRVRKAGLGTSPRGDEAPAAGVTFDPDTTQGACTVCGIVGVFYEGEGASGPVGQLMSDMCDQSFRRGPDPAVATRLATQPERY